MNESPQASVIIPTYERRRPLARALRAFAAQTEAPERFEVVVALDGGRDDTRKMLAELPTPFGLKVVAAAGKGRAAARNAALAVAVGELAILLDDDMEPVPEFVARHLAAHRDGAPACVLGAVPVRLEDDSPLAARHVRERFAAHLDNLAEPGHSFVPRDFYSGNVSIPAALLREVGAFDDGFTPYGNEDVELGVRLAKAGAEIRYDPAALAWQEYEKDLRGLAADTLDKGRTTVELSRRHPDAFPQLRLAAPREGSRPWLATRALLLSLTRRLPRTSEAAIAGAAALERLGLWRAPLFYRAVLDYCFWAGVDAELREQQDDDLAALGVDLHRGPIDLLLHG